MLLHPVARRRFSPAN